MRPVFIVFSLFASIFMAAHPATLRAGDGLVFTADLPFDTAQHLPPWMHGPPVAAEGSSARVAFRLLPPEGRDLLVHLVFDEAEGGNLRVEWQRDGEAAPEVLAENLGEGLGVPNQRPLLVSASRLGGRGTLLLQGGENFSINRVRFEWVAERTVLSASTAYVPVVVTASRLTLAEADVHGGPRRPLQDEWRGRVVRAPLTEGSELLTPALDLVAVLEQAPSAARLEAALAGVYLDQEVWLVVNGQEIGPLAIEVPTLQDPGHIGEAEFAGWRPASAYIPSEFLMPGDNSILLELRSPLNSGYRNRTFVREALLELSYPPQWREPDLSLPLDVLPDEEFLVEEEPPLPPISGEPQPAQQLQNFWGAGAGSF